MNGNTHLAARNGLRKHSLALAIGFTTMFGASLAQAATWDVSVTNLTNGNHFTPLLLTAHAHDTHIFEVGMPASVPLEHMAECGHLDPLLATTEVGSVDADTIKDPAGGVLAPGANTTAMLVTTETHLTVVAMVLPTNDAFLGLSQHIPSEAGTYTYYVNAYDAGTEQNDEVLMTSGACSYTDTGMMPGAPGMDAGMNGSGVTSVADTNTNIHVHRGVLGDQDPVAGNSDLNSSIHRWQNPVAKITVTVTP
jgi:hypothetical protein